ncbi:unnamed protein product [Chilo suppressalis]|uniref:Cilia- and flagella-associated protein 61 N-terminal domain-containing protein n=1 Tax=Chilo suppressalis TaxID=168631 RepID=A0ABN8L6X7_CHISP|nr:unnamed protein product [Chilo suppressalis]
MVSRILPCPALGRIRLACVEDAPVVLDLVNESIAANFRVSDLNDVIYLIENCILSICQLDANDDVVGFLAAKDHPLLPSVHPTAWEYYFWTKYKAIEMRARNTLFIHLLCWKPLYARELVDSLLKSMFMHDPYLQFIAMIRTVRSQPLLVPGQSRAEGSFKRLQAVEKGVPGEMLPALCVAERNEVSPRLRIRRAVEEDNDDIVPILERQTPRLQKIYGEFYISELISRHPESERVLLVCEHKELAVGVMCLNTQINFESLEESFDLSPFGGLRHSGCDIYRQLGTCPSTRDMASYLSLTNVMSMDRMAQMSMHIEQCVKRMQEVKFKKGYVENYPINADDFMDFGTDNPTSMIVNKESLSPPRTLVKQVVEDQSYLDMFDEDEEELEFDIINIDTDLLKVPKILTYDGLGRGLADSIMKILDETAKHKEVPAEDKPTRKEKRAVATTVQAAKQPSKLPEPHRFSGPSNAFLLELFAIHQDYDERYGFDMLEAAYELFPDRDYCILCLPSNHPPFPLLEHFTLVASYSTKVRFINETLYVAHVNSVRGEIAVRPGEASDMVFLNDILEHAPRANSLLDLFSSSLNSHRIDSFILLSQKQPIGMVILGSLEAGSSIRTQYKLASEPRAPRTDGTVLAGVMSPAFEPHARWYMRDVLRHSHYSSLFWICRLFARGDVSPNRNLMSLAGHMVPVTPRRSIPNISGNKCLDIVFQNDTTPFALWMMERPLTSLPKVTVNNSIVVVGASRTGLAFLEALIMGPASKYLTFTNITLVSEHGLPTVGECLKAAKTCVPQEGRYSDRYLRSVPFYYYVDFMTAVMTGIDRKTKCIQLKGGGVKFYDQLVLTCGHQHQHPEYLHEALEIVKEVEKGKPCERILMDNPEYQPDKVSLPPDPPENLMLINSILQAHICMRRLLRMMSDDKVTNRRLSEDNTVVVYGECVEAYNCLAALLELGLAPDKITFVEAFPPEDSSRLRVNCFNDETVDGRIQASIEKLGIRVLRRCTLAGWRQLDSRINAIHLMKPMQAVRLPCYAFFYYGLKAIDINAFKAINESGLVYDGGLVIGPEFETNDPNIYGAGPCCRYSRRLYADRLEHQYYCSEEVGEALATIFLDKLDPFVSADPKASRGNSELFPKYSASFISLKRSHGCFKVTNADTPGPSRRWQPVMKFESPIVQYSVLPGQLHYMKVRKPGPELPMEVQLCLPLQGHTLVTDKRGNFFRLHLNSLHCVDAITCLSKKSFCPELYSQLYGKHEAFFNHLLHRYQSNEIDDLFEFFKQPWMAAMYQETFSDLLKNINEQNVRLVRININFWNYPRVEVSIYVFCSPLV